MRTMGSETHALSSKPSKKKDDEEFQHFLNSRRGSTKSKVKVKYSNGSEGEL